MSFTAEVWSIISSVVSIILGILAVFLSIYFFIASKKTEKDVSMSLAKIETQAEALQKITGRQMDRLTKYVTEGHPHALDNTIPQLVSILAEIPNTVTATLERVSINENQETLIREIVTCYIALYFYTAQTNFWAQGYLPKLNEFDSNNSTHNSIRRIIDMSNSDFARIAEILSSVDRSRLESNPLISLLIETRDEWKDYVNSSLGVYALREKQNEAESI